MRAHISLAQRGHERSELAHLVGRLDRRSREQALDVLSPMRCESPHLPIESVPAVHRGTPPREGRAPEPQEAFSKVTADNLDEIAAIAVTARGRPRDQVASRCLGRDEHTDNRTSGDIARTHRRRRQRREGGDRRRRVRLLPGTSPARRSWAPIRCRHSIRAVPAWQVPPKEDGPTADPGCSSGRPWPAAGAYQNPAMIGCRSRPAVCGVHPDAKRITARG